MNNFKKLLASAMALTMVTSVLPVTNVSAANNACVIEVKKGDVLSDSEKIVNVTAVEATGFKDRLKEMDLAQKNGGITYQLGYKVGENLVIIDNANDIDTIKIEGASKETPVEVNYGYYVAESGYVVVPCDDSETTEAAKQYKQMRTVLESFKTIDLETVNTETTVGKNKVLSTVGVYVDEDEPALKTILNSGAVDYFKDYTHSNIVSVSDYSDYLESVEFAKNLLDTANGINALVEEIEEAEEFLDKVYLEEDEPRFDVILKQYEELTESSYAVFAEKNLTEEQKDDYDSVVAELESLMDEYGITGSALKTYVKKVQKAFETFVGDKAELKDNDSDDYISKTDVDDAIEAITKGGTFGNETFTKPEYKMYGEDNDAVQEILDELNAMYDEIEAVKDAMSSKNDVYKAFVKKTNKISVAKEVQDSKDLNALKKALLISQYETYKEFKEEVIDVLYTMQSDQIGDYYYDNSTKTLFASSNDVNRYLKQANELIFEYDEEEDEFGWDKYVAYMESVIEAIDVLENELPKYDSININASDRDAIIAARDAFDLLEGNTTNLTDAQQKTVRNAESKIDELVFTYRAKFGSLNVTTGWVDAGNGNWKYYEADGTAPTKWICTAKDTWYFVQNGVMLRNAWVWRDATSAYYVGDDGKMLYGPATTPDGYAIDANGLWHA